MDNSKLSSAELITFLEDEGYTFKIEDMTATHYVICYNDDIWVQHIDNSYIGPSSSFKNNKVNGEFAEILDKEDNETREEKEQYDAFLDWLDELGITKTQIQDVLGYYDVIN